MQPMVSVPPVLNLAPEKLAVYPGPTEDTAYFAINQKAPATASVPVLALTDKASAAGLVADAWKTSATGSVFRQYFFRPVLKCMHETAGSRVLQIHQTGDITCWPINGDRLDLRLSNLKPGRPKPGEMPKVQPGDILRQTGGAAYAAALDARRRDQKAIARLYPSSGVRLNTVLSPFVVRELLNAMGEDPQLFTATTKIGAAKEFIESLGLTAPSDNQLRLILTGKSLFQEGFEAQYRAIRQSFPDARLKRAEAFETASRYT